MTLASFKATRQPLLGQVVKSFDHNLSFESATVKDDSGADGRTDEVGTVYGAVLFGAPVGAVVVGASAGGGTGDGTLDDIALKAGAQLGVYTLECITEATNAGVFAVFDPNGNRLEDATVGVAYDNGQIAFEISDGDADFDLGDAFSITVPEGSGQMLPIDFSAVDGSQRFAAICGERTTVAAAGTQRAKVLKRLANVTTEKLIWPAGATSGQKAQAIKEANAAFIFTRTGV